MTLWRAMVGLLLALTVAGLAHRLRSLSASGAAAAAVIGTVAVAAGWRWGGLLLAFFIASAMLSAWRSDVKSARTREVVEKGGERDALQVLANGLVFAVAAALVLLPDPWQGAAALGAGALAAAASDTWATEVGTLASGSPRSVLTWRKIPPGTSGGVTLRGLAGAVAGAAFVASVAFLLGWPAEAARAAFVGGLAGSTLDTLLGATIQSRRWCDRCESATERLVHGCGEPTRTWRGLALMNNDFVNLVASAAGGIVAVALVWW